MIINYIYIALKSQVVLQSNAVCLAILVFVRRRIVPDNAASVS